MLPGRISLRRAEWAGVPSPLAGEGQGEGTRPAGAKRRPPFGDRWLNRSCRAAPTSAAIRSVAARAAPALACPLSPTLPRKGGGRHRPVRARLRLPWVADERACPGEAREVRARARGRSQ